MIVLRFNGRGFHIEKIKSSCTDNEIIRIVKHDVIILEGEIHGRLRTI